MVKTFHNYLFALGEIQNDLRRVLCLFVIYVLTTCLQLKICIVKKKKWEYFVDKLLISMLK